MPLIAMQPGKKGNADRCRHCLLENCLPLRLVALLMPHVRDGALVASAVHCAEVDRAHGADRLDVPVGHIVTLIYERPPDRSRHLENRAEYLRLRTAGPRLLDAQPWPREKRGDVREP
jgi:hypothetical protein